MTRLDHPLLANWQPPDDFEPAESSDEGITVFAPVIVEEEEQGPVSAQCPNCGAGTSFDIKAAGLTCRYCGYVEVQTATKVGRGAEANEFTLDALRGGEQGWGVVRQELHCDTCGAELALAEGAMSASCVFCASNHVSVRAASKSSLRPKFLVPFSVEDQVVRKNVETWLGKGWIHPRKLQSVANFDHSQGIYLPFWTFTAKLDSNWEAEVGYPETERYYDASSGSYKTRTVIKYRWESGYVCHRVRDLISLGSSHISAKLMQRIEGYTLEDLVEYSPSFLAGWQAQAFDIALPDAWDSGKRRMREGAKDACRGTITSRYVRNFSMVADLEDETWRYVLLPVWVSAYKFRNKVFVVLVNGQTGEVAG
ncbi:MAG: hypothetical protein HN348_14575, partial [Proteobacteria bacterium]|nr:hypothetical protein [Pseudomonadota bacterium]